MKMTMTSVRSMPALLLALSAPVFAQHEGHAPPGGQPAPASEQQLTACVQSQQQVMGLVEAANGRLELARQSNDPPAMRAAMDDLQLTLSTVRSRLASCAQLAADAPGAPMDHSNIPTGGTPPARKPAAAAGAKPPAAAAPTDHSKMPMGATPPARKPGAAAGAKPPAAAIDHSKMSMGDTANAAVPEAQKEMLDEVCGKDMDPETAPNTTYKGKRYYFCSATDRLRFIRNPATYLKKQPDAR